MRSNWFELVSSSWKRKNASGSLLKSWNSFCSLKNDRLFCGGICYTIWNISYVRTRQARKSLRSVDERYIKCSCTVASIFRVSIHNPEFFRFTIPLLDVESFNFEPFIFTAAEHKKRHKYLYCYLQKKIPFPLLYCDPKVRFIYAKGLFLTRIKENQEVAESSPLIPSTFIEEWSYFKFLVASKSLVVN